MTIVVNNAGLSNFIPSEEQAEADWEKMMNVNGIGAFIVTQVVLPDMKAANRGRVVNISSSSAPATTSDMGVMFDRGSLQHPQAAGASELWTDQIFVATQEPFSA